MNPTKKNRTLNIGLIGYGTVGNGVIRLIQRQDSYVSGKFQINLNLVALCDRSVHKKDTRGLKGVKLTKDYHAILNDPKIDVVVELIGGMTPAYEIITGALKKGKHVVTANKLVIAHHAKELFQLARQNNRQFYFESSVGAGIPIIKTLSEGIAGNKVQEIYAIINGTSNFILTEMARNKWSFGQALKEAQKRGYAESNPTLDINGMDSTHKLAILAYLAFGKFLKKENIYTEGISHISHDDIEHAESLGLCIKLLAIAKKVEDTVEARVHPTLISQDHPFASINGIYNAVLIDSRPVGNLLISGEGAGEMTAASGVFSDLINLASSNDQTTLLCNIYTENPNLRVKKIDEIKTKFYLRFMATDKPGVLSKITGILGRYGIGINSVTQKAHYYASAVPVIMLTNLTTERNMRLALQKIYQLPLVKSRPVAIRMEKLW